jgi:hypothetical protein
MAESPNVAWQVVAADTEPHWLALHDPEGWWDATVKPDGCIDIHRYFNAPGEDADDLHICDLDGLIARLQALKLEAAKHFGPEWPR